uniref:Uncharacterized protein n=1 Tax=Octopus bimaculoides TaxID=37653 RepID=A0A0L8HHN7_OCTBM
MLIRAATMPQKIPFHVAHVSSQDKNYSATELNYHGPLNKGWQSIRLVFLKTIIYMLLLLLAYFH